ncbi:MAG: sulfate adenylyltransferase subunit CysN [Polyangiaceae bacterium]|nr:sulfate adenylyltransferase subunit CysN [Polyangiaceae bacterium]
MYTREQEFIERDIEGYLAKHQSKELLRFVTVGSVDDGKSTLIGRLLHDTHGIYEDQLSAVKRASAKRSTDIDFSLFTDGLKAEREQGITIDVAYRYFSTENRKFIIADTPGHVQYTRNMATGASTADVALILIDARLGVLPQSRRHAFIAALLGIPHLLVCVNKMDLVDFEAPVYDAIRGVFGAFAERLGFKSVTFVPVSATGGDNVVHRSDRTPWYDGPTVLRLLETVPIAMDRNHDDFRFPVQFVLRPNLDYRAFAGEIASGVVRQGDPILVLPSRRRSVVAAIDTFDGPLESAFAPQSVAIRLADEIDISRGDMLVRPDNPPTMQRRFDAMLVWMSERSLDRKKSYLLKHAARYIRASVEDIRYTVDLETLNEVPAKRMDLNDIARVTVSCHQPLYFDAYRKNRSTGAFILVDSLTNNTVAAGMILEEAPAEIEAPESMRREHRTQVSQEEREERMGQRGATVWLTGLPGSGKTEVAYALERRLFDMGRIAYVIDPDDGLSTRARADGGSPRFTPEVARRLVDMGVIGIFAFASPRRFDRVAVRSSVGDERFVQVYVSTPLEECKRRDRRGAYGAGHVDPLYDVPVRVDVAISLDTETPDQAAKKIVEAMEGRRLFT